MGSPPLARGTVDCTPALGEAVGITPACAGNRPCAACKICLYRDHPRLRGEQLCLTAKYRIEEGSPPLARGTGLSASYVAVSVGITPACAGNSIPMKRICVQVGDHPRLRGEQNGYTQQLRLPRGSPPLARGTVIKLYLMIYAAGITPACAGNSAKDGRNIGPKMDHPRLRGEQATGRNYDERDKGSPPLARGTVLGGFRHGAALRITPACAGNSTSSQSTCISVGDHPRLRGEQAMMDMSIEDITGSPPLARGTD